MTADLCPTKSVSIMFGHRNRNSGRLARRSPKALKAPSFSRPAQMLEDGLAIAELVKKEERNAKRRAKRGSDPKATAVDNIVRTFTVLLFSAAFRAQVFPAIRSVCASIVGEL